MGIVSEHRIKEIYKHNILSVIFDSDSFFYAITDIDNRLNIAVKYSLEDDPLVAIPQIIAKETLADHYYSAVNIFSKLDKFAFVPASEYSYGNEPAFLKNSFEVDNDQVAVDYCSKESLHVLHAYSSIYSEAFRSLKDNLTVRHLSLAYLEGIIRDGVYITLYEGSTIIVVRSEGLFRFYNQFKTATVEDRMYFVMLTYDQLGISTKEQTLYVDGPALLKVELLGMLEDYIENFGPALPSFANANNASELRDLYLATLCE